MPAGSPDNVRSPVHERILICYCAECWCSVVSNASKSQRVFSSHAVEIEGRWSSRVQVGCWCLFFARTIYSRRFVRFKRILQRCYSCNLIHASLKEYQSLGFAILFQKFHGSEGFEGIKEISVVVNEAGTKTFGQMMGNAEGCKVKFSLGNGKG